MLVLIAVILGGNIGGILGVLLGVPTASAIYALVVDWLKNRNKDNENTEIKPELVTDTETNAKVETITEKTEG